MSSTNDLALEAIRRHLPLSDETLAAVAARDSCRNAATALSAAADYFQRAVVAHIAGDFPAARSWEGEARAKLMTMKGWEG